MLLKIAVGLVAITVLGLSLGARHGSAANPPLQTVEQVDLARYAGLWYEIARYPNRFQQGCLGSSATYTLRDDGEIDVVNACREANGALRQVKGRAWAVDESNARLKVSFFWPFRGDYWIVELGEDYDYVVVGAPNRKYLWILCRTPEMDDALYAKILDRLIAHGYDPSMVVKSLR